MFESRMLAASPSPVKRIIYPSPRQRGRRRRRGRRRKQHGV